MTEDVNKDPNPNPYFLYGFEFGSGKKYGSYTDSDSDSAPPHC